MRDVYSRVQVSEAVLEGLLRTHGDRLFPGFRYFDFKPAIPSRFGTRHPDGALLAQGASEWWVIEVETHQHDVESHVEPQLEALAEGMYGRAAFRYLERHQGFDADAYGSTDIWEPSFLLIVDHATPFVRQAAAAHGFLIVEVGVFRSESAEYVLRVEGSRPSTEVGTPARGVDVTIEEVNGVAILVPMGGRPFQGEEKTTLLVGDREVRAFKTAGSDRLVLSLDPEQVRDLAGDGTRYRVTSDGALIPLSDE